MKSIIKISVTLAVGQYDKLSSSKVLNLTVSILVVESALSSEIDAFQNMVLMGNC